MSYQALCGESVSTLVVSVHGALMASDASVAFGAGCNWWRFLDIIINVSVSHLKVYLICVCSLCMLAYGMHKSAPTT